MMDFFYKLNDKYEKLNTLTIFQHAIQALLVLDEQVKAGGYIQLIQNGFGDYIFNNPWIEVFTYMKANDLVKNMLAAKEIYSQHRQELEKEATLEAFTKMYESYPQLDDLQTDYLHQREATLSLIKKYVQDYPEYF